MTILLLTLLLTSCAQINSQDTSFEKPIFHELFYEFMNEAESRDFEFTFKSLDISVDHNNEYTDDYILGRCMREYDELGRKNLSIKINPRGLSQHYIYVKQLVFHELGHCLIGRDHIEDTLEDGNKKSIMTFDGSQIDFLFLEKNFKYYLDELFDPKFKTL